MKLTVTTLFSVFLSYTAARRHEIALPRVNLQHLAGNPNEDVRVNIALNMEGL